MGVNGGAVYLLRGLVWRQLSLALADLEILSGSRGRRWRLSVALEKPRADKNQSSISVPGVLRSRKAYSAYRSGWQRSLVP